MRLISFGLFLVLVTEPLHDAGAASSCQSEVEKLVNDSTDEDFSRSTTQLKGKPRECLIGGLLAGLQGEHSWRAIVITKELQLQDPRLAAELIDVLYEAPPDAGFSSLVEALTLQARGGGLMAEKIAAVLKEKRFRKQGLPRETAAQVLGASGSGGYPYIELLNRLANDDPDDSVREAARDAVKALIDYAVAEGDLIVIKPGSSRSPPAVKASPRRTASH